MKIKSDLSNKDEYEIDNSSLLKHPNQPIIDHPQITLKQAISSTNLQGVYFSLISSMFSSLGSVLVKKAHITNGPEQTLIRYLVQGCIMAAIIAINTKISFLGPSGTKKLLVVRGVLGTAAMISLHVSIKMINPSDTVALVHLKSLIVTVFARIFLYEKISVGHLTCLVVSIVGVFFIAQPSFLFGEFEVFGELNGTGVDKLNDDKGTYVGGVGKNSEFTIGISLAILTATLSAIVAVVLKKLSDEKVHYAVPTIYASYFGVPTSLLISSVMLATGLSEKDPAILDDIPSFSLQVIYSLSCALCGTASQVTMNWALNYEEAGKISIIRSTDLFFTYVFQYLWLGISTNWFSGIGAILIISGTFMILIYKIVDKKMSANTEKHSFFVRILLFKF